MKAALKLLMTMLSITMGSSAFGQTISLNPERTIRLDGMVDSEILTQANQLLQLASTSKEPISVVINSPGGHVIPGLAFVNAIKIAQAQGISIQCLIPTRAMSMALTIFAMCNKRYALPFATILWHPMRMGMIGMFTLDQLRVAVREHELLQDAIIDPVKDLLDIDDETFYYHFHNETQHLASSVHKMSPEFLEIVTDVQGLGSLFPEVGE